VFIEPDHFVDGNFRFACSINAHGFRLGGKLSYLSAMSASFHFLLQDSYREPICLRVDIIKPDGKMCQGGGVTAM